MRNIKKKNHSKNSTTRRKVKRVVDGDTFELYRSLNGSRRVRIANLNAKELGELGGNKAKNKLKQLIEKNTVTIKPVAKDRYSRVVADVYINRKEVKKQL